MGSTTMNTLHPPPSSKMPRRRSLRLPAQPPHIPIPPSLQHSPYLTSPIFRHNFTSPRLPSEEDERWLQDTIPIHLPAHLSATEGGLPHTQKGSLDRRGSIVQPSRRSTKTSRTQDEGPRSAPLEFDPNAINNISRGLSQQQLAVNGKKARLQNQAPYPSPPLAYCQWDERLRCTTPRCTTPRSAAYFHQGYTDGRIARVGSRSGGQATEYFPHVPSMR